MFIKINVTYLVYMTFIFQILFKILQHNELSEYDVLKKEHVDLINECERLKIIIQQYKYEYDNQFQERYIQNLNNICKKCTLKNDKIKDLNEKIKKLEEEVSDLQKTNDRLLVLLNDGKDLLNRSGKKVEGYEELKQKYELLMIKSKGLESQLFQNKQIDLSNKYLQQQLTKMTQFLKSKLTTEKIQQRKHSF